MNIVQFVHEISVCSSNNETGKEKEKKEKKKKKRKKKGKKEKNVKISIPHLIIMFVTVVT